MNENKNIDELSLTSLLLTEQFELEVNPWIKKYPIQLKIHNDNNMIGTKYFSNSSLTVPYIFIQKNQKYELELIWEFCFINSAAFSNKKIIKQLKRSEKTEKCIRSFFLLSYTKI